MGGMLLSEWVCMGLLPGQWLIWTYLVDVEVVEEEYEVIRYVS